MSEEAKEADHLKSLWLGWRLSVGIHIEVPLDDALEGLIILHREPSETQYTWCGVSINSQKLQRSQK